MRENFEVAVVIPTRNRYSELKNLLECLEKQSQPIFQVIVVDSSDSLDCQKLCEDSKVPIDFFHTTVRSAAIQRNIGMENLSPTTTHVAFLDDDVVVEKEYLARLIDDLELNQGIGISGVALNPGALSLRTKPQGLSGNFHRLFLLDSIQDGKLLSSAVNIPVRDYKGPSVKVEWLIGCSLWDYKKISLLRFESDFQGQSLGEDVIFSYLAGQLGELFTNPNVVIAHFESPVGRPESAEFYQMWVKNRYRLILIMKGGFRGKLAFVWANIGQAFILLYLRLRNRIGAIGQVKVIFQETIKALRIR